MKAPIIHYVQLFALYDSILIIYLVKLS